MPQFVFFIKADPNSEAGPAQHPTEVIETMTKYQEAMNDAGVLISGDAVAPTAKDAYNIKLDANLKAEVAKGPFDLKTTDNVGGWWIIQTATADEALDWAKKCPIPDAEIMFRRIVDETDLGPSYTPELLARDTKVRQESAARARAAGK
jgi:hypothetical protein